MLIMNTLQDFTSIRNHVQREKRASAWPCSAGRSPLSPPPLQEHAFSRTHLKSSHLCRKSYNSYFTKFQRNLHNHLHQSGFGAACMESKTTHLLKAEPTIPEGLYCKKFFLISAGDGYEAPRKCTSIHC